MFAIKIINITRGDIYFQHINHNNEGRLPVINSISFANLKKELDYKKL